MIGYKVQTRDNFRRVRATRKKEDIKNLGHALRLLRVVARRSLKKPNKSGDPSPEGQPPRSPTRRLKTSILYYLNAAKTWGLVGPDYRIIGRAGAAHEHGERFRGDQYPERPFMSTALEKIRPRLSKFWARSVRY